MTEQEEFEFRHRYEMEQSRRAAAPLPATAAKASAKSGPLADKPLDLRTQSIMEDPMVQRTMNYDATDARGGIASGFSNIGSTLLTPLDWAARKLNNGRPVNVGGYDVLGQDRRAQSKNALQAMGVDTDSMQFKTNELLTEIGATSGVGSTLAGGAKAIGAGPALVSSLKTGGMNVAGKTGVSGMATRAIGGALTGGATAGLVNPDQAGTGALIGALTPLGVQAAGNLGDAINTAATKRLEDKMRAFNQSAPKAETIRQSVDAGYIIPPNMVKPSLKNQVIESISGKQATQQIASARNEEVTGRLVRESLGIPQDAPLSAKALEDIRKTAGKAYSDVSSLSPQAASDLEALKVARNEASGWFAAYNRSARPDDLAKAKAARALTDELESALEAHAKAAGKDGLIPALREARKKIAKTYTVSRALNNASGTVDARVLGRMYEKGLPLSDGLDTAGRFASAFPTIAKSSQQVGSPAAHNLKAFGSLLTGGGGYAMMGPVGAAAAAVPFVAPPVARSMMFREGVQKGLLPTTPKASATAAEIGGLLSNPELQQLLIRSAPLISAP